MYLTEDRKFLLRTMRDEAARIRKEIESLYHEVRSAENDLYGKLTEPCNCDFCPHINEGYDVAKARIDLKTLKAKLAAIREES